MSDHEMVILPQGMTQSHTGETVEHLYMPPVPNSPANALQIQDLQALSDATTALGKEFRDLCLAILHADGRNFQVQNGGRETYIRTITELQSMQPNFEVQLEQSDGQAALILRNFSQEPVDLKGRIPLLRQQQILSVGSALIALRNAPKPQSSTEITEEVRRVCASAGILDLQQYRGEPVLPCTYWGGQRVSKSSYEYAKSIGRDLSMVPMRLSTGGGYGTMKGPLSGARAGYQTAGVHDALYVALTQPGIIENEPPNPHINRVVMLRNMEQRLEAFVRTNMGIIIGPGGVGTLEELLYALAILLDEKNKEHEMTILLAGPNMKYAKMIYRFLQKTLDDHSLQKVLENILIVYGKNTEQEAAKMFHQHIEQRTLPHRNANGIAPSWNHLLYIDQNLQEFVPPSHEAANDLNLSTANGIDQLLYNIRRFLTFVTWAAVSEEGNVAVQKNGPLRFSAEDSVQDALQELLQEFKASKRFNYRDEEIDAFLFTK